jgi:dTDP-4-amino-4,6-dideoxy-D-galactose acyltransferase
MTYQRLAWDSEFFGFRVGRIADGSHEAQFADSVADADADGARCVYLLLPVDDLSALHRALAHGFRPIDVRVELDLDLDRATPSSPTDVRQAGPDDLQALERLAQETIADTRFSLDPGFPTERASELYALWARRGVREDPPYRAFVTGDGTSGYVICKLDTKRSVGSIELIGVTPHRHGAGIGGSLVDAAHAAFVDAGCARATVVTQARNRAAVRLYESRGYRTDRVGWWLHRWVIGPNAGR